MCQLRAISQTRLLVCRRLPPLEAFDAIVCANVDIQVAPSQAGNRTTPPHEREVATLVWKLGNGNNVDDMTGTTPPRKRPNAKHHAGHLERLARGWQTISHVFVEMRFAFPPGSLVPVASPCPLPWPWPWIWFSSATTIQAFPGVRVRGFLLRLGKTSKPERRSKCMPPKHVSVLPTIPLSTIRCWPRLRGGGGVEGGRARLATMNRDCKPGNAKFGVTLFTSWNMTDFPAFKPPRGTRRCHPISRPIPHIPPTRNVQRERGAAVIHSGESHVMSGTWVHILLQVDGGGAEGRGAFALQGQQRSRPYVVKVQGKGDKCAVRSK